MHPALSNIIRSSTRKSGDRLKILTFSTHERYQSNMANINADFWVINNPKIKSWNTQYAEIPKNHKILNDIEKIFTDYSRTFNLPASKTNNKIFKHWYNSDIDGFDSSVFCESRIELNHLHFRFGKIQLNVNPFWFVNRFMFPC